MAFDAVAVRCLVKDLKDKLIKYISLKKTKLQ